MQAEEDYLQPWREIRTPYRLWTVPLDFPLTHAVANISGLW